MNSPSPLRQLEVFGAIAHPIRRQILDLLRDGERPVNQLAGQFRCTRPAVSQHLKLLLASGLVSERREGRERRYRLEPDRLAEVYDWLSHYERFWEHRLARLRNYLEEDR